MEKARQQPLRDVTATSDALSAPFPYCLFPDEYRLLPGVDDVYELHLAYLESRMLSVERLIAQGAFFESIRGQYTRHYLTCTGQSLKLPEHSSSRLKSFFSKNIFRTGYGTHGLFPYRGKFHPQMVRGLLNIMGLVPGETVLDPMMGSGTVQVEATLMGIDSIGIDASPFCKFMAETKVRSLTMDLARARKARANIGQVLSYFISKYGAATRHLPGVGAHRRAAGDYGSEVMEAGERYVAGRQPFAAEDRETFETYSLLFLAYLDSVGYAERTAAKSSEQLFAGVMDRYIFACDKIQGILGQGPTGFGSARLCVGDARRLELLDRSVDGILFSPPYSFAIDYVENDLFHLSALGVDCGELRQQMIGLRGGRRLAEKYDAYVEDMTAVMCECARVLKTGRICTVVIGTNSNQIGKALGQPEADVESLNVLVRRLGEDAGLHFVNSIQRSITGISNTMRTEHIVLMRK